MKKRWIGVVVSAALALTLPSVASAQLAANQWYQFGFDGVVGTDAYQCPGCGPIPGTIDPPPVTTLWTYASATAFNFTVQDLFIEGDRFELLGNAVSFGLTSVPGSAGANCGGDLVACAANSAISRGTFLLGPGSYTFAIRVNQTVGEGAAAFQITSATTTVPEPSTVALMAAGLAVLGSAYRRRKA